MIIIDKNLLVSIVMPAYNDERYIFDTINSVLNQTYPNIELIIVDDASKDNTISIVESFKDTRIKLFKNNTNQGAAYSRNYAIKMAKGDYIAFLDADDIWMPNKLEKQLEFMIANNHSFTYTNYKVIDDNGDELGILFTGPKVVTHNKFMRMNYIGCLTAMYKRDVYPDLSISNDIVRRNDYALWIKLSEKCNCHLLNLSLALYRKRNSGSITTSNKKHPYFYHKKLFSALYGYGTLRCLYIFCRGIIYSVLKKMLYKKSYKLNRIS